MSDREVVIVSAVRTPIGSFCQSLSSLKASDLGSIVIKECLERAKLKPSDVSEVILGQALTAAQGQNPARQAAIKAGLPISVPAYLVNMLCGSGLKSVTNAYQSIKCGESDVIVAGGQESMSQAPHAIKIRNGVKMGNGTMIDTMICDGLTDAFSQIHMGITAENIAKSFTISRKDQDEYAVNSQLKTEAAIAAGYFDKEIVPVTIPSRKVSIIISKDEYPKTGSTIGDLEKLKPVFDPKEGTVTAGNASGINDGAAALVLMSREAAAEKGVTPLARIVAVAQAGVEPNIMGTGPIPAVELVLKKANWTKDEVDLYELNEAFAVQSLVCLRNLGLDPKKVNVNGGAIALGHPIGASGARILVTLLHLLERTKTKKGVASLCIGGGMGIAIAVERI
ncbi:acetyl-CoA acetyltransferase, cytosolic [Belonocnema kinseyi]|uniref:acetyl-CoA acetyltransferase, cytosolic n=1 Tax=Belonocnema kinseyi TaxID=2817044 RepID=UPI00143CC580|nr:acetyl-CoA acetyltransferase, cytosolic [Belonocnema kinseyi]XP_033213089.1 acetyl-CoA acetyltransferase, cytosolic [Belonocnema kinseyi]XP_033213090.1 acetyl-CoA acetyltransferase, cytosolic [Belonocnema kinseyi]